MTPLFKKLNFKNQNEIVIINSPKSFEPEIKNISEFTNVRTAIKGISEIEFILIFVTKKNEIEQIMKSAYKLFTDDVILWFSYPKGTSKKYKCDFNRDNGWDALGELNFEGVRIVSIDEDWSALRFRKVKFIKKMTRNEKMILSKEGAERLKT